MKIRGKPLTRKMKKPVIRSPLDRLPKDQQQALLDWLTKGGASGIGMTYAAARERLKTEFGVTTSMGSLSDFYHRHARGAARVIDVPLPSDGSAVNVTISLRLVNQ